MNKDNEINDTIRITKPMIKITRIFVITKMITIVTLGEKILF